MTGPHRGEAVAGGTVGPPGTATGRYHIGLNLLWLVPGVVGGSETYTVHLLRALADSAPDDLRFTLFANARFGDVYADLMAAFPSVTAPVSGAHKGLRVLAETTWLGVECGRRRVDLVHHFGGVAPLWRPAPTVLTIHDLQPFAYPEHFGWAKRTFAHLVVPPSVRTAARLVVLSEGTRDDVAARLGTDPARFRLVPPGFDPPAVTGTPDERVAVRARYALGDRPFFLYPAITYPHKNHEMLINAFARLCRHRPEPLLVLSAGAAQCEDAIRGRIETLGLVDRVRRIGRVSDADLDLLYREAVAMTFPSRYEGFGLPVLEAMSRGCPVIAADTTALPEVVGTAGLLMPPDRPDRWSDAMADLLDDPDLGARLAAAGSARAREFDWGRSAAQLADVYRELRDERVARKRQGRSA